MNSRTWLNLGLLILAGALVIVSVYLPGVKKPTPLPALTSLTPASVTSIRIERTAQPAISLKKEASGDVQGSTNVAGGRMPGATWRLTEPLQLPANTVVVESFLGLAQTASHAQWAAASLDLEKFKLKTPRIRVRLNDVELGFGDTEPLEGRRYVLAGNTVHLINDGYYPKLIAPPAYFASLALLPGPEPLKEIELPGLTLRRDAQGWSAQPGASDAQGSANVAGGRMPGATPDAVNTLVQEWTAAQALRVRPYSVPMSQDKPPETVTVRQGGALLRFIIVSRAPELILARPEIGVQYHLP
ncbi:MAG TPA: DUF4340 domain-containing protein, partial [Gammaproteobacteria bacterium]|nr:DUF4340 domain-containing protein [Gammaproteobacteria bacterium]